MVIHHLLLTWCVFLWATHMYKKRKPCREATGIYSIPCAVVDRKSNLTDINQSSIIHRPVSYYIHSVPRPSPRSPTSISTPRPSTIPHSAQTSQARPNALIGVFHPHALRHLPPRSFRLQSLVANLRAGQISLPRSSSSSSRGVFWRFRK